MEEGVSTPCVNRIWVCSSLDQSGCKCVVKLTDVFAREVGRVQLLEGQPQSCLSTGIAEVKVETGGGGGVRSAT